MSGEGSVGGDRIASLVGCGRCSDHETMSVIFCVIYSSCPKGIFQMLYYVMSYEVENILFYPSTSVPLLGADHFQFILYTGLYPCEMGLFFIA